MMLIENFVCASAHFNSSIHSLNNSAYFGRSRRKKNAPSGENLESVTAGDNVFFPIS